MLKKIEQITWPEGTTPIEFIDWLYTLPQAEQEEYSEAWIRQEELRIGYFRTMKQDGSAMVLPSGEYAWKDEETFNNRPVDPVIKNYWNRWETESGVQYSYILSQI
jgi:hypothetical protein